VGVPEGRVVSVTRGSTEGVKPNSGVRSIFGVPGVLPGPGGLGDGLGVTGTLGGLGNGLAVVGTVGGLGKGRPPGVPTGNGEPLLGPAKFGSGRFSSGSGVAKA